MPNRRQLIMREHAMSGAPRAVASLFWQRYNQRWRAPEKNIGDLAGDLVNTLSAGGPIAAAWNEVVPAALRGRTCADQLSGGTLSVLVDSKATAYVLARQFAPALIAALNRKTGGRTVRKITCRVRPAATGKPAATREFI